MSTARFDQLMESELLMEFVVYPSLKTLALVIAEFPDLETEVLEFASELLADDEGEWGR